MLSNEEDYDFFGDASAIFESYLDIVQVLLVDYEVITGEFLTQALNEIRSVFTHIARANRALPDNPALSRDNMLKAERHVKRAVLDCYKALCLAYFKEQKSFDESCRGVDLRLANNGQFLPELQLRKDKAARAYALARHADCEGVRYDDDQIFALYEEAYLLHKELDDFRNSSLSDVEFARAATDKNRELAEEIRELARKNNELAEDNHKRAIENDKLSKRSLRLTIFGGVMTIVSIALAVVALL